MLARYESKGFSLWQWSSAPSMPPWPTSTTRRPSLEQPWYPPLRDFITSGPLVVLVPEGPSAIESVRTMNGATNGGLAAPGSIRGDSLSNRENLVHA